MSFSKHELEQKNQRNTKTFLPFVLKKFPQKKFDEFQKLRMIVLKCLVEPLTIFWTQLVSIGL